MHMWMTIQIWRGTMNTIIPMLWSPRKHTKRFRRIATSLVMGVTAQSVRKAWTWPGLRKEWSMSTTSMLLFVHRLAQCHLMIWYVMEFGILFFVILFARESCLFSSSFLFLFHRLGLAIHVLIIIYTPISILLRFKSLFMQILHWDINGVNAGNDHCQIYFLSLFLFPLWITKKLFCRTFLNNSSNILNFFLISRE